MKYGAMNFPIKPVLEELDKVSGLGFDYLEIAMDPPCAHHATLLEQESEIVQALKHHSLGIVCHLPTFVYTADLTPAIREASLEEVIFSLKVAARLGAKKAVLHPSFISGLGPYVMEMATGYACQSFGAIVKEAQTLGVTLCLENMFPRYHWFFDPDHFVPVFNQFPRLKMTLDTGHANMGDPSKTKLLKFIERFPDRIGHVHVSDNGGKRDEHLAVGQGTVNFEKFAKLLIQAGYEDTITLEIFSPDPQDLVKSRERLARLFSST